MDPQTLAARLAEVYLEIGPLYRKVARIVERDESVMGMSVGVRAVLDQLRREGDRTVPHIARTQDLSRQFIQRMVNHAKDVGYVELVANPVHRRSRLVRLTTPGRAAIEAVAAREHSLMGCVAGDLTDTDLAATLHVLRHMRRALDELDPGETDDQVA